MDEKETLQILKVVAEAQQKTAEVKLTIGTTSESNIVQHGGVYITDCPATITIALIEAGYTLSMNDGKLCIDNYNRKK